MIAHLLYILFLCDGVLLFKVKLQIFNRMTVSCHCGKQLQINKTVVSL